VGGGVRAARGDARAIDATERASRAPRVSRVPINRRVPREGPGACCQKRAIWDSHLLGGSLGGLDDGLGGLLGGRRLGGLRSEGAGRGGEEEGRWRQHERGRVRARGEGIARGRGGRQFIIAKTRDAWKKRAARRPRETPRDAARGVRARWIFAIARARGSRRREAGCPDARVPGEREGRPGQTQKHDRRDGRVARAPRRADARRTSSVICASSSADIVFER
jgi:hypothetical protein